MTARVEAIRASSGSAVGFAARARLVAKMARPRTALPGVFCFCIATSYVGVPLFSRPALLGALISFLLPLIANIHNSLTDLPEDILGSTNRVELVEALGFDRALRVSFGISLAAAAAAPFLGSWQATVFFWLACVFTFQYSAPPLRAKARPFLGLVAFVQAVAVPYAGGLLLNPSLSLPWLVPPALASLFGIGTPDPADESNARQAAAVFALVCFWFFAKGTFKNFVDYEGDRRAGLSTSATVFPSRHAAFAPVAALTIVAYLLPLSLPLAGVPARVMVVSVLVLPALLNLRRLWVRTGPEAARVLRDDMTLSSTFAAALLLLTFPDVQALAYVVSLWMILILADVFALDARRPRSERKVRDQ